MSVSLRITAYDSLGRITGSVRDDLDLVTVQWPLFVGANIFATTETIKDTGGTNRSVSANTLPSALTVLAGTGANAASVADNAIQTPVSGSSGSVLGTLSAISQGATSTGTATILATITNTSGGTVAYTELGIQITAGGHNFLLTHDIFSSVSVANNGSLAIVYVISNS